MAPNADCETARLSEPPIHQSRRVLPQLGSPAQAWTENEDPNSSPGENKRLLPLPQTRKSLQAGLTLGVHSKYPSPKKRVSKKTKFQKRKEKLIAVLKPPYFIVSIIFIIVTFHLFGTPKLRKALEWSPKVWLREPWRLVTYGFLHATATHLAINALVALAIGWLLEREQGWWRVCAVWAAGVGAGALGAGALQPGVRVVGASAAVYALLTAHLPNVCFRFGHIPLWWFRPLSVAVLVASEAWWAAAHPASLASPASPSAATSPLAAHPPAPYAHSAWSAHLLGAAIGLPLGFLVFTGENAGKAYIVALRVISALVLTAGAIVTVLHYTLWHEVEPT